MKGKHKSRNLRRMLLALAFTLMLPVSVLAAPQKETAVTKQTRETVIKRKNKITASSTSVYLGKTKILKAKALGGTLKYKSSNTKIVSVTSKGVIKGLKTGSAVITISTKGNAKYQGASKKITVKVVKKKGIPSDKLKYKYEVKFFNQPYDGMEMAYFIKTNNPNPDSFEVFFYNSTGNPTQYFVSTGDTFFDIYNSKKLDRYYKTRGGYIQIASLDTEHRTGIYNIAIRELDSLKQAYMGKIRIKNEEQDRLQWMNEIIAKVTTPSMTKPEKMSRFPIIYIRIPDIWITIWILTGL